ncbi:MAG: maleylacetoacetate isomerase [Pseudomonadota bacterium]
MELFEYFRSSTSYRTRIALNLKGLEYTSIPVHLTRDGGEQGKPDYRAKNPQGLVPTLRGGDFLLNQSLAIIEWLDETHPEPRLLPEDKNLRAKVRAFAYTIACDIHPLQNLRVLKYLTAEFDADQAVKEAWCQRWLGDGLAACEAQVSETPRRGEFCFGNTPGLADICLVPQIFSAFRFKVDTSSLPNLMRIYEACQALPAFADAAPAKQADAQ